MLKSTFALILVLASVSANNPLKKFDNTYEHPTKTIKMDLALRSLEIRCDWVLHAKASKKFTTLTVNCDDGWFAEIELHFKGNKEAGFKVKAKSLNSKKIKENDSHKDIKAFLSSIGLIWPTEGQGIILQSADNRNAVSLTLKS